MVVRPEGIADRSDANLRGRCTTSLIINESIGKSTLIVLHAIDAIEIVGFCWSTQALLKATLQQGGRQRCRLRNR